jgi:hypothetical protein
MVSAQSGEPLGYFHPLKHTSETMSDGERGEQVVFEELEVGFEESWNENEVTGVNLGGGRGTRLDSKTEGEIYTEGEIDRISFALKDHFHHRHCFKHSQVPI